MNKKIVISAVNLRTGGTLSILRDCLGFLDRWAPGAGYDVYALVHDHRLFDFANINYIDMPEAVTSWRRRLKIEYREMLEVSRRLAPVELWFSLHDTTPNVEAHRRAVYCHNPFPFYYWRMRDLLLQPKIVAFSLTSKYIYQHNIHKNDYVVVQQQWLREAFVEMFGLDRQKIIVSPPEHAHSVVTVSQTEAKSGPYTFLYASRADSHKNFELACQAAEMLEKTIGPDQFRMQLTISGDENRYARWLKKRWGHLKSLEWLGFLPKDQLEAVYAKADCLVFPSRTETWGLPISEFKKYGKPMLLPDLPYAYETAQGADKVAFFISTNAKTLEALMRRVVYGHPFLFEPVEKIPLEAPYAEEWHTLFHILLS